MNSWEQNQDFIVDLPNKRIKILNGQVPVDINFFSVLRKLEAKNNCTKTIVYSIKDSMPIWIQNGFQLEGKIDGYFSGQNAYLLTRYTTEERSTSKAHLQAEEILKAAMTKNLLNTERKLTSSLVIREAQPSDIPALSTLYKQVFPRYPNPIFDYDYLRSALQEHLFMVVECGNKIISVCSAEINPKRCCAELTDCATDPLYRGQSLLGHLLVAMEKRLEEMGILYLFSLTRALSAAMNVTVAKQGYAYRGRLINNCDIYSGFEDMNIWVKPLRRTWD